MKNVINSSLSTLATLFIFLLGGWDISLQLLIIVMGLDYLTGVLKAIYNKEVSSEVGLKGIIKKAGYLVIVSLSVILDRITGETGAMRTLVIYFFVANEGISILENWGGMGLPLPQKIFDVLRDIKQRGDN